ncbi:MAG: GmrSD restriction endonuclease domain-containing protein [Nocardioides sp.]
MLRRPTSVTRATGWSAGIDLVARQRDGGGLTAIQCTFYEPGNLIAKHDIDSFLSASGKEGLGNLTLATPDLNGTMSHRPWTDAEMATVKSSGENKGLAKRALLNKFSPLVISRQIVDDHPDEWTEADIEERYHVLTTVLCEVWPGPPDAASS